MSDNKIPPECLGFEEQWIDSPEIYNARRIDYLECKVNELESTVSKLITSCLLLVVATAFFALMALLK